MSDPNVTPNNEGENNAVPNNGGENDAAPNNTPEELKKEISLLDEEKEKLKEELNKIKEEKEQLEKEKGKMNDEIDELKNKFEENKKKFEDEISKLHQNKETLEKEIHDQMNYFREKLKNCTENESNFKKNIEEFIHKLQNKEQQNEEEPPNDTSNNNDATQMENENKEELLNKLIETKNYNYSVKQMDDLLKDKKLIDQIDSNKISNYIINYLNYQISLEKKDGPQGSPLVILQNFDQISDETMHRLLKIKNFTPIHLSAPYIMSVLKRLFSYKNLLKGSQKIVLTNNKIYSKVDVTPLEMKITKNSVKDINEEIVNIQNALEKKVTIEGRVSIAHNLADSIIIKHLII